MIVLGLEILLLFFQFLQKQILQWEPWIHSFGKTR